MIIGLPGSGNCQIFASNAPTGEVPFLAFQHIPQLLDRDAGIKRQVSRRASDQYVARANGFDPSALCGGPVLKSPRSELNGHRFRLTRLQMNSIKCRQGVNCEVGAFGSLTGRAQVNLWNLITGNPARVLHLEAHIETAVA